MDEKALALRLAAALDVVWAGGIAPEAAAELRRLHALNGELLEALKDMGARYGLTEQARAAIAKVEGEPK